MPVADKTNRDQTDSDGDTTDDVARMVEEEVGKIQLSDEAPEVDLNILVVENNGLDVVTHAGMGRVTVATRDFTELHSPVLREIPAIVCSPNDYMEYMEKFLSLPLFIQVGILDMFYQPLTSSMGQSLVEPAKLLFLLGILDDFTVIHQLLSIYATNAHQYKGDQSALPIMGSKIAHSCYPNVGYASQTEDGCVEYKVIRPIKKGDMISFSYLSDLFETPTFERRQILMKTKSFFCKCTRCCEPDYCRYIKCPNCETKVVPCRYKKDGTNADGIVSNSQLSNSEPYWDCPICDVSGDDGDDGSYQHSVVLRMERELETTLKLVERTIHTKTAFKRKEKTNTTPSLLLELVQECSARLSPVHYLTIKALRLTVNLCTSLAYIKIKQQIVRYGCRPTSSQDANAISSLFRRSVDAGFQLVAACECVSVGCPGCGPLLQLQAYNNFSDDSRVNVGDADTISFPHDPLYDRSTPMRHVCDNLVQLPLHWWPSYAVKMTKRYVNILKAKYGNVEDIETEIIQKVEALRCFECETMTTPT